MEDQMTDPYLQDYENFLKEYKKGLTDGERVGEVICIMTQHFCTANQSYGRALVAFNRTASIKEQELDENTGKTISSAKATKLSEATSEFEYLTNTKISLGNLEQIINSCKSLQKGILKEGSYTNNT